MWLETPEKNSMKCVIYHAYLLSKTLQKSKESWDCGVVRGTAGLTEHSLGNCVVQEVPDVGGHGHCRTHRAQSWALCGAEVTGCCWSGALQDSPSTVLGTVWCRSYRMLVVKGTAGLTEHSPGHCVVQEVPDVRGQGHCSDFPQFRGGEEQAPLQQHHHQPGPPHALHHCCRIATGYASNLNNNNNTPWLSPSIKQG